MTFCLRRTRSPSARRPHRSRLTLGHCHNALLAKYGEKAVNNKFRLVNIDSGVTDHSRRVQAAKGSVVQPRILRGSARAFRWRPG
jgi:hypothetical protein